jgi:hypothetical protein
MLHLENPMMGSAFAPLPMYQALQIPISFMQMTYFDIKENQKTTV